MKYTTWFLCLLLIGCAPPVQKEILSNGIVLLTKPIPNTDLIAIDLLLRDGQLDETAPGIRNLIQTLIVKGTLRANATELALRIDLLGSFGTSTGNDYMEIQIKITKDKLETAIELLAELIQEATFPPDELEKERIRVLEAIKTQQDNPTETLKDQLLQHLYPNHPYGLDILGTPESVRNLTHQDLLTYYQTHYVAPRLVVSVVGSVDPVITQQLLEHSLANLSHTEPPRLNWTLPKPVLGKHHQLKNITDNWIGLAYPAPPFTHPDRIPTAVMNAVLGGSMAARLFTRLRDQQGLAYNVGSSYESLQHAGHLFLYIGTHPENQEKAAKGLLLEAKKLRSEEPPTLGEVHRAINRTLGNYQLNHETLMNQAAYLARYEALGLGYDYDKKVPELIRQVTLEDVQRVAQNYLRNATLVIVGPK